MTEVQGEMAKTGNLLTLWVPGPYWYGPGQFLYSFQKWLGLKGLTTVTWMILKKKLCSGTPRWPPRSFAPLLEEKIKKNKKNKKSKNDRGTRWKGQNWKFINPLSPRSVLVRTWTVSVQFSKMAGPQRVNNRHLDDFEKKIMFWYPQVAT